MKDIKILAILVGVVTDIGSTQVILLKFIFFSAMVFRIEGENFVPALTHQPLLIEIAEMLLGALGSFLGGFVTARMAGRAELKNALLMGLASNLSGAALFPHIEHWRLFVGSMMTFAATAIGGYLSRLIRLEDEKPASIRS